MNLTKKLLGAAVALAISGAASAAGNSDVYVEIGWAGTGTGHTGSESIIIDLGAGSLSTPAVTSYNLASIGGANWTSFFNAVTAGGATTATLDFMVLGGGPYSTTTDGNVSFRGATLSTTTQTALLDGTNLPATSDASQAGSTAQILFNNVGAGTSAIAAGFAAADSLYTLQGTPSTNFTTIIYGNGANPLWLYYGNVTTSAATNIGQLTLANLSSSTGTLQLAAAVPEPGTFALMAAGLLAVAAVARRRTRG